MGALCRPRNAVSIDGATVEKLVPRIADWQRFLALLTHHRLIPLAARSSALTGASEIPEKICAALRSQSGANAREAFRYLAVLDPLLAMLEKESIHPIVLKGVPLSYMAYGDVSARDVGDIDLLIEPGDALRADTILQESGLLRKEPGARLTPRRASFYLRSFKDFTYDAVANGFEVDLHWRLLRDSKTAAAILPQTAQNICEDVRIGSLTLRVLPLERTMLFLSAHGAMEGWARWKTLADIAALWMIASHPQRLHLWRCARESSAVGFLAAALILAARWFDMDCQTEAEAQLEQASMSECQLAKYIVNYSSRSMLRHAYVPSPAAESSFAMKLHESRMHPTAKSRVEMAGRILFRPRIWEAVDLPDFFFPLYPLVSPFEWISFRSRMARRHDQAKPTQ